MSTSGDEAYLTALASAPRRRVLDALVASAAPLSVQAIASQVGLHITTARFHLDHLERAGLVSRRTESTLRRGRPTILYAPAGQARDRASREQLIEVLVDALSGRGEAASRDSQQAGRRWGSELVAATHVRGGYGGVVEALEQLGFEPELTADEIRLHACPFRDSARMHPEVVCSVHRGLLEQILAQGEDGDRLALELLPLVEPELCLVHVSNKPE